MNFKDYHEKQRLDHLKIKQAVKNASIKIANEKRMREISEAFEKTKRKMNEPIYYNGGTKSFFWWRNKLKYKIKIVKDGLYYFETNKYNPVITNPPKIFDTILDKLNNTCIGLWQICIKRIEQSVFASSEYSVHITFSNSKDATYFKILWG